MDRNQAIRTELLKSIRSIENLYNVNIQVKVTIGNRNFERYIDKACTYFGHKRADFKNQTGQRRGGLVVEQHRAVVAWCYRYLPGVGPSYLGRMFTMHHTSILHMVAKHDELLSCRDFKYMELYSGLENHMNFSDPVSYTISLEEQIA